MLIRNACVLFALFTGISVITTLTTAIAQQPLPAPAPGQRPNILVIWGDDVGVHNVSAYSHGIMGYKTPNYRSHCARRRDVHGLLCAAKLHGRARLVHPWAASVPHRPL